MGGRSGARGSGMTNDKESVVVVGAGIVGIACAHYLNDAGYKVTVIDRGTVANACSHANCGYISPSHVLPLTEPAAIGIALKSLFNPDAPFRVKPRLSLAQWKWFGQFLRRCNHQQVLRAGVHLKSILDSSIAEYRDLISKTSIDGQWKETGMLYVLQTDGGMEKFAKADRLLTEHFELEAKRIEGDALQSFDPALKPGLAGGFFYPNDASVRPDVLNAQWADHLRDRGVTFIENCELNRIDTRSGNIAALNTTQGVFTAGRYVFAMGAWSPSLSRKLQCKIPIEAGKGYSVTMSRPDPCPRYPMLLPEHKVGVSPFDDGYRLGSMMEFAGYDTSIPERRIQQLRKSAEPYLIAPHTEEETSRWFGWRPMTWDSLPIIGGLPALPNGFLATGHNMLGLSLAAGTGKLISELVQGCPTHIDAEPFSPRRF